MDRRLRLGSAFELRADEGSLRRTTGEEIHLRSQTLRTLVYLIAHRDRVVTRDELMAAIWGDVAVTDDALVQCVVEARKALDDDARRPRYIRTVLKRGYRFVADVEAIAEPRASVEVVPSAAIVEQSAPAAWPAPMPKPGRHAALRVLVAVGILAGVLLAIRWLTSGILEPAAAATDPKRITVAVMYLENQSRGEDLEWMRKGLADMLITALTRSDRLRVISREQVDAWLTRLGHAHTREIPLTDAIEIARRAQADYFVLGGFARLGSTFRIDLRLYDATGALRAAEQLSAAEPGQVLTDVDSLSWKLARRLGEDVRAPIGRLAAGLTADLDAFRYYSLGVERALAYEIDEAIRLFEQALALDPQFVMARARIGFAHITNSDPDAALPHLEQAFRGIERITERDRLHLEAWRATANRDYEQAIDAYRRTVARYPADVEAYGRLGNLLIGEKRYDEAIGVLRRGLDIDAESGDLHNFLARALTPLGRHDEAIRERETYVALEPNEPLAYDTLGLSYQWAGRYEEAIAAYQKALDLRPDFAPAVFHLGHAYFHTGRYRAALERYQRYGSIGRGLTTRRAHDAQALVHLARGDLTLAERHAAAAQAGSPHFAVSSILIHARPGAALDALARRVPQGNPFQNRGRRLSERVVHVARARLALAGGQPHAALSSLRQALQEEPPIWDADVAEDCLAKLYVELGRYDEAVAEYQRVLRINPRYPLAHYGLAVAYERSGRLASARTAYEEFLRVWSQADADVPEVRRAERRVAVLTATSERR